MGGDIHIVEPVADGERIGEVTVRAVVRAGCRRDPALGRGTCRARAEAMGGDQQDGARGGSQRSGEGRKPRPHNYRQV